MMRQKERNGEMRSQYRTVGLMLLAMAGLFASPVAAEVDLIATNTCLADRLAEGQNPSSCVDQAHQRCLTTPDDMTAAAVLCFSQARETWRIGITAEMERITETADDRIAAIAGVELKYDLLANLMQCDRMEELAKVGSDATGDQISRQRAQCDASASGLAYLRVRLRAESMQ
ncbi:MAG: hypothetical protein DCO97_15980 [Marivita sp. XM-24bin2]|nr:MAG: hypothetical protein DCO97_15980 [Marivita sp. XM-24bin2]